MLGCTPPFLLQEVSSSSRGQLSSIRGGLLKNSFARTQLWDSERGTLIPSPPIWLLNSKRDISTEFLMLGFIFLHVQNQDGEWGSSYWDFYSELPILPGNYNLSPFYFEVHDWATKSRVSDSRTCHLVDVPSYLQICLINNIKQFFYLTTHPN